MRIEIIKDLESLKSLEPDWNDLAERVPEHTYFQRFEWLLRGWECVGNNQGQRLHIAVGRQDGRVVLIWPLVVYTNLVWRIATWMGPKLHSYGDVLVENHPQACVWLKKAWEVIAEGSGVDAVFLWNVRAKGCIGSFLEAENRGERMPHAAPMVVWSNPRDWSAYYASLSRNFRKDQRRQRRRLDELGMLKFEVVDTLEAVEVVLDWMLEHKIAWLKHVGKPRHRVEPKEPQTFLKRVVKDAWSSGALYLAKLLHDEKCIAVDMGFVYQGRFYNWMGTYDLAWSHYSPGRMLTDDSLQWAHERGIEIFDFMPSQNTYKYNWAKHEDPICDFLIPCTAWGKIYTTSFGGPLGRQARKFYAYIPKGLQSRFGARFMK